MVMWMTECIDSRVSCSKIRLLKKSLNYEEFSKPTRILPDFFYFFLISWHFQVSQSFLVESKSWYYKRKNQNVNLPNALARQLAVVAMVMGSELAATVALPAVDLRRELGSMKTKFEPLGKRTPCDLPDSLDRIAHCMFCGAKLVRWPCPAALL